MRYACAVSGCDIVIVIVIVIVIFVRCYRHRLPLRPAGDARNALGVCTGTARET
jgi:hypothetical protein